MKASAHRQRPPIARVLAFWAMLVIAPMGWSQTLQASSPAPAAPQPDNGIIRGIAAGTNGDVYQGVLVTLTESGTMPPVTQTQTTDVNGAFQFDRVSPGAFQLTLSSKGFVTQTVKGVLHAGETWDAHTIVLTVAVTTSSVHVTASQAEIAQAQLHIEEKQRVLGVIPNYFVTYDPHAAPLTARQKFQLSLRSAVDPVTIGSAAFFAGIDQASNLLSGYGQGAQGYGKRFGAVYADTFVETMVGGAIFPALLHQDPRYFVKGTGSVRSRVWYAIYNAVMCKGDNGKWQVNYSGILGGLAAGGISQLYYPASDRGSAGTIFAGVAIGTGTSTIGNLAQEFLIKKLTPSARKNKDVQP
jgi:hypothetical protein